MRSTVSALITLVLLASSRPTLAQTAYSVELGAVTAFDDAAVQIGARVAPGRGAMSGADVALATFPDALAQGLFLGMLDVDFAYGASVAGEKVLLFPRLGASAIFVVEGGGGAAAGYNLGVGVLFVTSPGLGVRLDYTYRRFAGYLAFSSVSVGMAWIL